MRILTEQLYPTDVHTPRSIDHQLVHTTDLQNTHLVRPSAGGGSQLTTIGPTARSYNEHTSTSPQSTHLVHPRFGRQLLPIYHHRPHSSLLQTSAPLPIYNTQLVHPRFGRWWHPIYHHRVHGALPQMSAALRIYKMRTSPARAPGRRQHPICTIGPTARSHKRAHPHRTTNYSHCTSASGGTRLTTTGFTTRSHK